MRSIAVFILFFFFFMGLSACGKSPPPVSEPPDLETVSPLPTPTSTPTLTPVSPSPIAPPDNGSINPLTGYAVENIEQLSERPIALVMNNIKVALPMSGISEADIIYETLVEGGITRMLALFQDASYTGAIGSIRSTRTCFLELALGHDSILLHAGASYLAEAEMPKWGVDHIDGIKGSSGNLYYRDQARVKSAGSEHSMFTTGERIAAAMSNFKGRRNYSEQFNLNWNFIDKPLMTNGEKAESVTVSFTNNKTTKFFYNPEDNLYFVEQQGSKFVDNGNKEQVSASNVLVLYTDINQIKGDDAGRLNIRLTGEGSGSFIHGGLIVPISWSKKSRDDPFVFTLEDGNTVDFGRGKSYICIIPTTGKITSA